MTDALMKANLLSYKDLNRKHDLVFDEQKQSGSTLEMCHSDRSRRKADSANPRRNLFRNQEKTSSLSHPKQGPNWMKQRPSSKKTSGSGTRFELYLAPCPHHQQHCWQYQSVRHKAMNSPKRNSNFKCERRIL